MSIAFTLNGAAAESALDPQTPLLWVLRDGLGLTGTKFGCGKGLCGACTVHLDGAPVRACSMPLALVAGRSVTTIEGLGAAGLHPVQQAWVEVNTPQCGYCQPGQVMSAAALLASNPNPGDAEIEAAMSGNLCRCGTYPRIRRAIHRAVEIMHPPAEPVAVGVETGT